MIVVTSANQCRGSNWIHGSKDNPILKRARDLANICFEPPEGEDARPPVFDESGCLLDSQIAARHAAIAWDIVEEAIRYSRMDGGASIPPEKSLINYFEEAIKARKYEGVTRRLVTEMADMWSNIVGEPVERQSLRYLWLEECIEGGQSFVPFELLAESSR